VTFISPGKVFAHSDRLWAWKSGNKPAPVTVEWDLSNRCSLGCSWCHFAHTHTRGPLAGKSVLPMAYESGGDLADLGLVSTALKDMAAAGVLGVVWSGGGEPTLHPYWQTIVAVAASHRLHQGMYTHGGHVDDVGAPLLAKMFDWVVVSLDAADGATYAAEKGVKPEAFERACKGIERIAAVEGRTATLGVSFLLHAGNWSDAASMREVAFGLGADYVTFRPTIQTTADRPSEVEITPRWVTEALPTLRWLAEDSRVELAVDRFEAYRDWAGHGYATCHGVKVNATITPDGRIWLCPQRRGIAGSCVGDLRVEPFAEIWAKHPGSYAVDDGCRVMCRLHQVNQKLAPVFATYQHEAFV
jgi:MoaA/NifB/PqqE/SkfB family radical SAM enzyme